VFIFVNYFHVSLPFESNTGGGIIRKAPTLLENMEAAFGDKHTNLPYDISFTGVKCFIVHFTEMYAGEKRTRLFR
jgi:hypothetical protein